MTETANVYGGSRDPKRGAWTTPADWTIALGRFDFDPFSNPFSTVLADADCQLERGDDGFGDGTPGSYQIGGNLFRAGPETRGFYQPGYDFVLDAIEHYAHTRFCFLLRFDPRTKWFKRLYALSGLVCVCRKIEFVPPPGVKASANPFPHAVYYRNADDVTSAVLRKSAAAWRPR